MDEVRPTRPFVRAVNGHEIAVFRIGNSFYAVSNVCPHQHAPVLAGGELCGTILTCPMHGWQYDLRSGSAINASGRLRTFEVLVDGEDICVRTPEEPAAPAW